MESHNLDEHMAKEAGGKIFTYGSYRLGVYGPGSDIDTLVVVPKHISREDFFTTFEPLLRDRPEVTELAGVPDAYVPIIKFKWDGISIDLIFARLCLSQVPITQDLHDPSVLKNIDEKCVKSLNGTRVTDEILRLVPTPEVFKKALRAIKLWAQRRGTYSNVMGFPGGVAWAMLVARICQLYPRANSAVIISKFYRILVQWNWPQPILLKPIEDGPLNVRVWNPKLYAADKSHKMPIITPAYPSMCATHNITSSTMTIIIEELRNAGELADRILVGKAKWSDLFAKSDFFMKHKYYLSVQAASKDAEQQLKWAGCVESKLRQLILKLETLSTIDCAHPHIKHYDKLHFCATEDEATLIAHGKQVAVKSKIDLDLKKEAILKHEHAQDTDSDEGKIRVYTTTFYIGLNVNKQNIKPGEKKRVLDISWPAQEFSDLCKSWSEYKSEAMNVAVRYFRNVDLPDEVFDDLANRPRRESVRSKKRTLDDILGDTSKRAKIQASKA
ncbi:Poly(A) polymerase [Neolecta irregularis DAH-3]|uniref:Poly(A) polymerase n=1 Tax=Neolecta irregularis (strain DAH-3) TaxID=1198029 RepID=A0A1U7LV83_NEOID|nr:Poly(A) polymerase [Neolecta irregularis DAH-3]|eukprot:OLL26528.1 Poly(A) polymerase [Neolecta irregularis DAH-3]